MSGTFPRSAPKGSKDDTTPPSTITALTSGAFGAASGAFGAAIGGKGLTSGIKKLVSESQHDSEDDSGTASGESSSDESESSDSSLTRVEQQDPGKKTSGDLMRHKAQESADFSKKPRAKVNANNIISDFSGPMRSLSGGGTDRMEVRSELARSSDSAINARHLWNKAQTVLEEPVASQYKRSHPDAFSFQASRQPGHENNVSFAATRSDVSRSSDSSSRRASRPQTTIDAVPYYQRDNHNQPDVRSELVSRRDAEQATAARAKIRATSITDQNAFSYQEAGYLANPHSSTSRAALPRSPSGRPKAWSDVVYQPPETQTEVSRISDPGPRGTAGRPTIRVAARLNDHADGYYDGPPTHSEIRRKPKVSLSAMMNVPNVGSQGDKPRRRVTQSAQMSIVDEGSEEGEGEGSDIEDSDEDEASADESVLDEEEDMLLISADPEIRQKFRELKISNKSLSSRNAKLASTVREQEAKLAETKTVESVAAVQHQQSDSISKMEELLREMSGKLSEQETEIAKLKVDGETKPKTRMALFMDPRSLPLNSLPRIIFERAYDDVIILFTVVTSLIYTIYIFPLIVMARSTKQLADKGQARFLQLAEEMHLFDVQTTTAVAENSNASSSTSTSSSANPDKLS